MFEHSVGDTSVHVFAGMTQDRNIKPGLEVRWYAGTSLVGSKSYRHFFLTDCHTGMLSAA